MYSSSQQSIYNIKREKDDLNEGTYISMDEELIVKEEQHEELSDRDYGSFPTTFHQQGENEDQMFAKVDRAGVDKQVSC